MNMEINKNKFLEGLKEQFESADAKNITFDVKFSQLPTWDSLTRFSIIASIEDDYNVIITAEQLNSFETPSDLFSYLQSEIK